MLFGVLLMYFFSVCIELRFYTLKFQCMSWSWYLANDTQFYIIGILLLIISVKHLKIATTFFVGFLLVSWITTAMITLKTGYTPR